MRILIAIPCLDTINTMFCQSLMNMQRVGETGIQFMTSSLVYDSRNKLSAKAIEDECDYILWLDSDMVFNPDLLVRLIEDMKDADVVTALAFARRPPYTPCIYKKLRPGIDRNEVEQYLDYPQNELFEIDACGMAVCLMKTSVLASVMEETPFPFAPITGYGEDLSFCIRAKRKGFKFMCDSRIKVQHIGTIAISEDSYLAYRSTHNA